MNEKRVADLIRALLGGDELFCEVCGEKITPDADIRVQPDGVILCSEGCLNEDNDLRHQAAMDDAFDESCLDYDGSALEFADPGGRSALRAAGSDNPRCHPCPTCGEPNRLTRKDVFLGYQCDVCADAAERGWP